MKLGLNKKIILTIELIIVIVAISSTLVSLSIQKKTLESLTYSQLKSVSVLKEYSINRYISHIIEELEVNVNNKTKNDIFIKFLRDGSQKQNVLTTLDDLLRERSIYLDLFIMNKEGVIVASVDKNNEGKIRNQEPFFINGKEKSTVHDFYYNVANGVTELIVTTPIRDRGQVLEGILASKINIKDINSLMSDKSGLGKSGESFIVNSLHLAVTDLLKEPNSALKKSLFYLPQIDFCLEGNSKSDKLLDYYGDEVYGYWRYVPLIKSCLVTAIDSKEALTPMRQIAISIFGIISFIGIVLGIIGYLFGRSIVDPLRELTNFSRQVEGGNFKVRAKENRRDEIGELGKSFNFMTKRLEELYTSMDDKVKEKTSELSTKVEEIEKSKLAILNLLEDIELEKSKVEGVVKERTQELNSEKARLLASINSLSFGFIIADMNHRVLLKNRAIIDLFGLNEKDDISINNISKLLGDNFDIKSQVELCLKDRKVCEIKEIAFGSKFFRGIIAPVLTQENQENIGYVFLLEDITEMRAVDKAKTEFVSLASHQLRTPLSAINWYTEMLLSGDVGQLKPEQQEFLEEIITSSKRMSSLVGILLNVSRIELGTFAVEPENKDLCQLIEDEIRDLKVQFSEKQIELELSFKLNPAFISVDPKLISIVIQNFLTNAIKYTPENGQVNIIIEQDQESGGVILSVIDNGYGIPKKDQNKIFTKMYRADNASAVDADGNGLGLYMVKSILDSSGCKVSFESPPSGETQGTAFHVHIPKEGMKRIEAKKRLGDPMS